jgi:hypothetical protein
MPASIVTSIDVGGDRYFLGTELKNSVDLLMKKRDEFTATFDKYPIDIDRIEELFKKYLPVNGNEFTTEGFKFPSDKDRTELLAVLERRLTQLAEQMRNSRLANTVYGISFYRIYNNIQTLIQQIKATNTKAEKTCDEDRAEIAKKQVELNKLYDQIIAFAAALSAQKSKKSSTIDCDWAAIMKDLPNLTIGEMIAKYEALKNKQSAQKPSSMKGGSHPVNYFEPQHEDDDAYKTIQERIESLSIVLELKQYLDKTSTSQKGSTATFDKKLSKSMMPLFDYFGVVFDPIYSFLEGSNGPLKGDLVSQLLTLLACCKSIYQNGEGIYRITNVDSDVYDFLCEQMHHTKEKMETLDAEEQTTFLHHIESLPKVIHNIPSDKLSTASTNPIRFFMVNENMTLPFKRKRSKALYDATTAFFKKGDIYLVFYDTTNCPMTTYEMDFLSPDIIINYPFMKKEELCFNEVVTLKESILYTDSELALSIFIAFKDLLPK